MRKLLAVAAMACGFWASAASAQTVDIATLKCSDIASMKPDELGVMLAWMDGYLGGRADDTRFDIERFTANAEAADRACEGEPDTGLLSVLKEVDGQ